jgi:hypothetical protein
MKFDGYEEQLLIRIEQVHFLCHGLCKKALGEYLSVSGNIGIFCQSDKEYEQFTKVREELTEASNNPNQKYFKLTKPIKVQSEKGVPEATYTHLYIRKYDLSPYGKNLGDVDFVLGVGEYERHKFQVEKGEINGAEMYDRPGWDTVQIVDPNVNAVAYVSTQEFAEKVRVKFD